MSHCQLSIYQTHFCFSLTCCEAMTNSTDSSFPPSVCRAVFVPLRQHGRLVNNAGLGPLWTLPFISCLSCLDGGLWLNQGAHLSPCFYNDCHLSLPLIFTCQHLRRDAGCHDTFSRKKGVWILFIVFTLRALPELPKATVGLPTCRWRSWRGAPCTKPISAVACGDVVLHFQTKQYYYCYVL